MEAVGVVVTVGLIVTVGPTDRQTDRQTQRTENVWNTHTHTHTHTAMCRLQTGSRRKSQR